jgi:type IV secretory pathway VirB10-like protein
LTRFEEEVRTQTTPHTTHHIPQRTVGAGWSVHSCVAVCVQLRATLQREGSPESIHTMSRYIMTIEDTADMPPVDSSSDEDDDAPAAAGPAVATPDPPAASKKAAAAASKKSKGKKTKESKKAEKAEKAEKKKAAKKTKDAAAQDSDDDDEGEGEGEGEEEDTNFFDELDEEPSVRRRGPVTTTWHERG